MRRGGMGKRRDASEKPIVAALRAVGAEVWHVSGSGLPDLLVRYRGVLMALEVKTAKGRLTKQQTSGFPVVRTVPEALTAIGATLAAAALADAEMRAAIRSQRGSQ